MQQRGSRVQQNQNLKGESIFHMANSSGIELSPKSILVSCLVFISIVVVLHFFDKMKFG